MKDIFSKGGCIDDKILGGGEGWDEDFILAIRDVAILSFQSPLYMNPLTNGLEPLKH